MEREGADVGRALWLKERRRGIGGTDAAAILGLSKWSGPLGVWMSKLGKEPPKPMTQAMRWGLLLEPAIAQAYEESTGRRTVPGAMLCHPEHPALIGSPDRLVVGEKRGLELKTASGFSAGEWGEPGTDEVPPAYVIQCAHYMALTGFDAWDLAVLIAGQDFRVYTIRRDLELEQHMVSRLVAWWERHIVAGERPPLDGSADSDAYLAQRFPTHSESILRAGQQEQEHAMQLYAWRQRRDEAEEMVRAWEAKVKESIGDAAGIEGEGWRATWRTAKGRTNVDWKGVAEAMAIRMAAANILEEEAAARTTVSAPSRRFTFNILKKG